MLPKALNDPLGAALEMVQFVVDAGGADNIIVVLIPYPEIGPRPHPPVVIGLLPFMGRPRRYVILRIRRSTQSHMLGQFR